MADLTPRQAEILRHLAHLVDGQTVYVRPAGNTDCANLHTYSADSDRTQLDGTTYSRVLYPLRDAGLVTIGEKEYAGRPVEITEHGRLVLTSLSRTNGLAGIEARLQLAPTHAAVNRYMDLAIDTRRMARVLHEIARELDLAEQRGESTVAVSRIRYDLRGLSLG